jgi:hypothetical protein
MICRFVKALSVRPSFAALVLGVVFGAMPMQAWCQAPGYPQAQPAPVYPQPQPAQPMQPLAPGPPAQQQQQAPGEYAFRGDLTNPEYGECLALERTWQANWYRYAAEYRRAIMMNPKDPNFPQMTRYIQGLKQQLDQSWSIFSSKCIYFPNRE